MEFLKKLVLMLSGALTVGLVCLLIVLIHDPEIDGTRSMWVILSLIVFLVVGIVIGICVHAMLATKQMQDKNQILYTQLDHEGNMYRRTSELYERTRKMNHDMKAYLLVILGYLENAEYDEARTKIVDMLERQLKMNYVYFASSGEINAVLNDKMSYANEMDIEMDLHVSGQVNTDYAMDVAIILANLLDNALEAAKQSKQKKVLLEMYEQKGMYYMNLSNSIAESVLEKNPRLQTTKKEKRKHGIGLKSVRQLVRKMDGTFQMFEADKMFCSCVSFPNEKG